MLPLRSLFWVPLCTVQLAHINSSLESTAREMEQSWREQALLQQAIQRQQEQFTSVLEQMSFVFLLLLFRSPWRPSKGGHPTTCWRRPTLHPRDFFAARPLLQSRTSERSWG